MPQRTVPLATGEIYHIFNRGVEKRIVFTQGRDYAHFVETLSYYLLEQPPARLSIASDEHKKTKGKHLTEILAYCLMPNHFHLLIKQLQDGGISTYMRRVLNSYTRYFNVKYTRVGHLFQGQFKAVHVESNEQLLHVSRYIHLNPVAGFVVKDIKTYPWSSYLSYINSNNNPLCNKDTIMSELKTPRAYEAFVTDHIDYAQRLEQIKHLLLDEH